MSSTRSGDHCTLSLRLKDPSVEVTFEVGISLRRRVVSMVPNTNKATEGVRRSVHLSVLTKSLFSGWSVPSAGLLIEVLPNSWSGMDPLGCLNHYLDVRIRIAEQLHIFCILRIFKLCNSLQKYLILLVVAINQAWFLRLGDHSRWSGVPLLGLLREWALGCKITCLTLPVSGWRPRGWGRCRGIAFGRLSGVIVNSLHMIPEIPVAWEAISRNSSLTTFIGAEERFVAVSMHSMSFALMAEQASRGRKAEFLAGVDLTFVWLQVRIHEFASTHQVVSVGSRGKQKKGEEHTRSCT